MTDGANAVNDPIIVARFWSKVAVGRPGQCWEWQRKSRHNHGYGVFRPGKRHELVKAHRFAWSVVNGPIPDGLVLRHRCDNPPCCNPAHLEPGTQGDNVADMHDRKRRDYSSRISAADVSTIRSLARQGRTNVSIAAEFGLSQSYISMLLAGRRGVTITKESTYVR